MAKRARKSAASAIARDQLASFVERIERLEEEKAAIADDIKAVYAEAKANGFGTKTLRAVIRIRKQGIDRHAARHADLLRSGGQCRSR